MKKTILTGFLLGLVSGVAMAWWFPVIDHERVRSLSTVQTNGGRLERFRVRPAEDRLMAAPGAAAAAMPARLEWPAALAGRADDVAVYHLRDEDDRVIGIASRVAGAVASGEAEWVLFIPARGTMLLSGAAAGGSESGSVAGGTGLFDGLDGDYEVTRDADGAMTLSTVVFTRDAGGQRR